MFSSSSTSSLLSSTQPQSSTKTWESSFGRLSSSYGITGSVPSLPQKSSRSTKSSRSVSTSSYVPQPSQSSVSQTPKDYERSFGLLSSSYGFSGSYPTVPSKVTKSKTPSVSQSSPLTVKDNEKSLGDLMVSNGFGSQYLPTRV